MSQCGSRISSQFHSLLSVTNEAPWVAFTAAVHAALWRWRPAPSLYLCTCENMALYLSLALFGVYFVVQVAFPSFNSVFEITK